jgi:predicted permease
METLIQDLRFALRSFWKKPGMIIVAVLMLGLGIGANTALFSVTDALLLKKLPVKNPEQLVLFDWEAGKDFRISSIRGTFARGFYPEGHRGSSSFHPLVVERMREWSRKPDSPLADVFSYADIGEVTVVTPTKAEMAKGQVVSGTYFNTLGVTPLYGRMMEAGDDSPSATPTVVLGYQYWKDHFDANPAVVGTQVTINKVSFTVIGVTRPEFSGTLQIGRQPAISLPVAFMPQLDTRGNFVDKADKPAMWWLHVMGRLKPGATHEQAFRFLNLGFQELALSLMPEPRQAGQAKTIPPNQFPFLHARVGDRGMLELRHIYSSTVYLLFGVVGIVLLIACANVANLLLARASERAGEITVRRAVGAGRVRILRQLVTESLLLCFF